MALPVINTLLMCMSRHRPNGKTHLMSKNCDVYNLQLMVNAFANSVGGNAQREPAVWGPKAATTLYRLLLICSQFSGKSKWACVNSLLLHLGGKLPECGSRGGASWWAQQEKKQTRILSSCSDLGTGDYKEFRRLFDDSYFQEGWQAVQAWSCAGERQCRCCSRLRGQEGQPAEDNPMRIKAHRACVFIFHAGVI